MVVQIVIPEPLSGSVPTSLWPTDRFPAYTHTLWKVSTQKSDVKKEKGKGSEDLRLITFLQACSVLYRPNIISLNGFLLL